MTERERKAFYQKYLEDGIEEPDPGTERDRNAAEVSETIRETAEFPWEEEITDLTEAAKGRRGRGKKSPKANPHEGHRKKLRDRFIREKGFENFEDHQILELLLFYANPRGDTNPIAHELLDRFDNLKNVLEARTEKLMAVPGVGENAATLISMVVPLTRVWERSNMRTPTRIGNSRDAEHYCKSLLLGEQNERFYVICLNAQCQVVGKRRISEGSLSEVSAYPRSVVETSLNHNAHSVLLCHNHPGGTCAPSPEDISSTLQLQRILNALNILVLDHIIVAGNLTYSMIQHGDIDYRIRNR